MTIVDHTLGNGLRVLALWQGSGPLVEARLHVPAPTGTGREIAAQAMLAALLAARSTVSRAGSERPAGAAAQFTAWADYRRIGIAASCAVGGLDTALGLIADAVTGVATTDTEHAVERDLLVTRMRMRLAHPDTPVRIAMWRQLFGDHPVTMQVPDIDHLRATEPGEVRRHTDQVLRPDGATLVVVGPDDPQWTVARAEALLGDWPTRRAGTGVPPLPRFPDGDVRLITRPDEPRTRIRLRAPAVPHGDPRYPAAMVTTNVVGAGTSSRLVRELRERRGYVYGVSCHFEPVPGGALLALEADTACPGPALDALAAELRRLLAEPPAPDEIDAARRRAVGTVAVTMASRAALATCLAELAAAGSDPLSLFRFADELRGVTRDAVHDATVLFAPERFAGLVAGDLPPTTRLQMGRST